MLMTRDPRALLIATTLALVAGCASAAPEPEAAATAEPQGKAERTVSMMATAYCDGGTTKSGTQAVSGTAAADPTVLPIGTVIRFVPPGGAEPETFTIADTGAAVKGQEVDVFIADCAKAKRFGRQQVLVTIVSEAPAG
jgi:3D (Asp-Asp-Asp) domain-containing protein